jgi:hypothetical protein
VKKTIIISLAFLTTLGVGAGIGWWANSPSFDLLCSSPYVYELGKDIQAEGISIKAGTQINLRSCEYANRFSLEMYYDKGLHDDVFIPINSAPNTGNHGANQYDVEVIE